MSSYLFGMYCICLCVNSWQHKDFWAKGHLHGGTREVHERSGIFIYIQFTFFPAGHYQLEFSLIYKISASHHTIRWRLGRVLNKYFTVSLTSFFLVIKISSLIAIAGFNFHNIRFDPLPLYTLDYFPYASLSVKKKLEFVLRSHWTSILKTICHKWQRHVEMYIKEGAQVWGTLL